MNVGSQMTNAGSLINAGGSDLLYDLRYTKYKKTDTINTKGETYIHTLSDLLLPETHVKSTSVKRSG